MYHFRNLIGILFNIFEILFASLTYAVTIISSLIFMILIIFITYIGNIYIFLTYFAAIYYLIIKGYLSFTSGDIYIDILMKLLLVGSTYLFIQVGICNIIFEMSINPSYNLST